RISAWKLVDTFRISAITLPKVRMALGSCCGPSTISATRKMTRSSGPPGMLIMGASLPAVEAVQGVPGAARLDAQGDQAVLQPTEPAVRSLRLVGGLHDGAEQPGRRGRAEAQDGGRGDPGGVHGGQASGRSSRCRRGSA